MGGEDVAQVRYVLGHKRPVLSADEIAAAGHELTLLYGGFDGSSETTAAIGTRSWPPSKPSASVPSGTVILAAPSPSLRWPGIAA